MSAMGARQAASKMRCQTGSAPGSAFFTTLTAATGLLRVYICHVQALTAQERQPLAPNQIGVTVCGVDQ